MTAQTFTATATDSKTGLSGSKTATFNVGTGPAPFPSVLKTSGQNLVDANGSVMPFMPGFCVPVYKAATPPFPAADFQMMYGKGARIVRVMVYWDQLEPTKGNIDTAWVQSNLDVTIQRALNSGPSGAGMYVWLGFYFGPQGIHMPTWAETVSSGSAMGNYVANGQNATQYLANRYGNPSSAQYTPGVIGMGINEPTPDYSNKSDWIVNIVNQQVQMATWMRAKAPAWILSLAFGFGSSAPIPNAPGSGQTAQTFTAAPAAPTTNFWADHHNAFWCTNDPTRPNWDGRNAFGLTTTTTNLKGTDFPSYPPVVGGTTLSSATLRSMGTAYLAPLVAYCSPSYANCPLYIGEFPYNPVINGTSGIPQLSADKHAVWSSTPGLIAVNEWDYATNQTNDAECARPGVGKPGADPNDPNGWQLWTNTVFANFPH